MRAVVLVLMILLAGRATSAWAEGKPKGPDWGAAVERYDAKQAAFNTLTGCLIVNVQKLATRSRETADVVAGVVVTDCMPYVQAYAEAADIDDVEGLRRITLEQVVSLVVHLRVDRR